VRIVLQTGGRLGDLALIEDGDVPQWAYDALLSLKRTLESSEPMFPCLYGVRALRIGMLRYTLVNGTDDLAIDQLACDLEQYISSKQAKTEITSLLAVFPPDSSMLTVDDYGRRFWTVLEQLHERDSCQWPSHIPSDPNEHLWEFCFAGEAIFAFAACPAYVRRRSRRTETLTMAFQPRAMFDRLFQRPAQLERARTIIRRRVLAFDGLAAHPDLGLYHDPANREWRQYVVPDDDTPTGGQCPMRVDCSHR
jgi:uncharacterized protein